MLVDPDQQGNHWKEAEEALDKAGITVNKNGIPFDHRPPQVTSGIRLGTAIVSTRGMKEAEMHEIAKSHRQGASYLAGRNEPLLSQALM